MAELATRSAPVKAGPAAAKAYRGRAAEIGVRIPAPPEESRSAGVGRVPTPSASASAGVTPQTFASAVLEKSGIKPTPQAVKNFVSWEAEEGGNWNNDAKYNPLNTTYELPGAGNTGSQGNIKVYNSWQQGIEATAKTLASGDYAGIRSALAKGAPFSEFASAVNSSPWGTKFSGEPGPYNPAPSTGDPGTIASLTGSTREQVAKSLGLPAGVESQSGGPATVANPHAKGLMFLAAQDRAEEGNSPVVAALEAKAGGTPIPRGTGIASTAAGTATTGSEAQALEQAPQALRNPANPPVKTVLPKANQVLNKAKSVLEHAEHHPVSIPQLKKATETGAYSKAIGETPVIAQAPAGNVHKTPAGPVYLPHKRTGGE